MNKLRTFNQRLKEDLKNKEFRKAFEAEEIASRIAIQIARLREKSNLTQRQLSKLLHTSQQTVSRLEHPDNKSLTISTLQKLAQVFHKELVVQFK
ncbi:MAG: hypothetical protein A3J83_08450 [Elusimicrobia bacterium RIFOXYA2_FULL_40_6]|nr:MAG: hypothetical protein A3J83_08450 [Elusimicrobia bacterium RIFOXYA2_FULL_40_6]